ncbi:MAG: UxaA family hydrolase [Ruminococcaceae bacterium]|nr:UxaA family hydrolase [Oscillospiraceae bacterium]
MNTFMGYPRPDGRAGVRNHVLILPSVACVNGPVDAIARAVPGVVPLYHGLGCGRSGSDSHLHARVLTNLGTNPNVAAVLVIGLGCEGIQGDRLAKAIAQSGKPVEFLNVQTDGGSRQVVEKGTAIARKMLDDATRAERVPCGMDKLVLGLQCGGSDALSGVTANPAVGLLTDWLAAEGGTALLTEVTEMIGTAHILERRGATPEIGRQVKELIDKQEAKTKEILGERAGVVISPGNMDGGMSTIREKSLGCICKAGSGPITQVVGYGEVPTETGLVIMDGPGYDIDSMTGIVASGANVMVFTTGRGTPAGYPIVPVIKVSSNTKTFLAMPDDIDVNAGRILEGATLQDVGDELIALTQTVADGQAPKAEAQQFDGAISILCTQTSF